MRAESRNVSFWIATLTEVAGTILTRQHEPKGANHRGVIRSTAEVEQFAGCPRSAHERPLHAAIHAGLTPGLANRESGGCVVLGAVKARELAGENGLAGFAPGKPLHSPRERPLSITRLEIARSYRIRGFEPWWGSWRVWAGHAVPSCDECLEIWSAGTDRG
jgi:hypothetical protein